jgi:hypothetical protein
VRGGGWSGLVGVALALTLALAACGDDDDSGGGATNEGASFAEGTTMARLNQAGTATVGTKFDQPLFGLKNLEGKNLEGKPEGFDVEIAKLIAGELGIWCWDRLAGRLAGHGHQVQAVQLRGHDTPGGRIWHRVHHYVQDVGEAAARFVEPPVLVGHSLGGLVVQKYLEHGPAPGHDPAGPLPHRGTLPAIARLTLRHPTGHAGGHPVAAAAALRRHPGAGPGAVLDPPTPLRHWSTAPSRGSRTSPGRPCPGGSRCRSWSWGSRTRRDPGRDGP